MIKIGGLVSVWEHKNSLSIKPRILSKASKSSNNQLMDHSGSQYLEGNYEIENLGDFDGVLHYKSTKWNFFDFFVDVWTG